MLNINFRLENVSKVVMGIFEFKNFELFGFHGLSE